MGEPIARQLARTAWAAQDAFVGYGAGTLHAEQEFRVVGSLPAPGAPVTIRTAVVSAEASLGGRGGTLIELVVRTELLDAHGTLVAVCTSTSLLGPAPWRARASVR